MQPCTSWLSGLSPRGQALVEVCFMLVQVKLQRLQQEYANAQNEIKTTRRSAAVDIQGLHQLANTKINQLQV